MKKYIKYVLIAVLFMLFILATNVEASTGATIFIGEPILLDNYNNIEISYNRVEINEETSEISNVQLFTNLSSEKVTKKATIKLEDTYSGLTINSLKILVNGLEIENIEKIGDEYVFYFEISPNEGKKIDITYKTDSNLQNAKIIKYTMDKLSGKEVKLFQINVKLSKYDIPLVKRIWPGAYEFENEAIGTEYVDFKVNNLTSSFIIQKETYRNLKYGEYAESLSNIDDYILSNAKRFIDGNMEEFENIESYNIETILSNIVNNRDYSQKEDSINIALKSVVEYALLNKLSKDNNLFYTNKYGNTLTRIRSFNNIDDYCLTYQIYCIKLINEFSPFNDKNGEEKKYASGKMVAINYYETEQGKNLYVEKDTSNSGHIMEVIEHNPEKVVTMQRDEYSILRTVVAGGTPSDLNRGIKKVYVNSDIDGNKIEISESEIIQFVNMMNVELYIRIILYDPSESYPDIKVGYYKDKEKQIAEQYVSSYELYRNQKVDDFINLFENEEVKNTCKVPTIAHCVGKCESKDGKYMIDFYNSSDISGFGYIYGASECETAKIMLEENKNNNNIKRNEIVNKISNTRVVGDSEEYIEKTDVVESNNGLNINNNDNNSMDIIIKNPIILGTIIFIFVLVIILILIIIIRGKKNGRK